MARKPLAGTVVHNVLAHGTGALNIDGCRIDAAGDDTARVTNGAICGGNFGAGGTASGPVGGGHPAGRWPANLIHDGSEEVLALFPYSKSGGTAEHHQRNTVGGNGNTHGKMAGVASPIREASEGSTSRFFKQVQPEAEDFEATKRLFYCAKASRKDRNEGLPSGDKPAVGTGATMREREDADWSERNGNHHPTVKPTDLMAYLCRLVTPPGGTVLDPFMGSGSTGKAAMREGFRFIGCELSQEYMTIARARIEHELAGDLV